MKTWYEYKEHVKNVDPDLSKDIHETEEIAAVVSAMVQQRNKLHRCVESLNHLLQE